MCHILLQSLRTCRTRLWRLWICNYHRHLPACLLLYSNFPCLYRQSRLASSSARGIRLCRLNLHAGRASPATHIRRLIKRPTAQHGETLMVRNLFLSWNARAQPRFKSWGSESGEARIDPSRRSLWRGLGEPLPRNSFRIWTSNRSIWCIVER